MKRYIKSNTSTKQTLREYAMANKKELQDKNIIVSCLYTYDSAYHNGDMDCPGVLFDGTVDELLSCTGATYLTPDDLDQCFIESIKSTSNGIEILMGKDFLTPIAREEPELVTNPEYYYQIMNILDDVALSDRDLTGADRRKLDALYAKDMDEGVGSRIEDYADANDCYTPNGDLCSTWDEMVVALRELFESGDRVSIK